MMYALYLNKRGKKELALSQAEFIDHQQAVTPDAQQPGPGVLGAGHARSGPGATR